MTNEEMISLLKKARDWTQALSDNNTVLKNAAHYIRCCIKELQLRKHDNDILWHDGKEEPKHNGMCLVYASYEYEEYPEDNYSEYTTSAWHGDWTEDHFPSDADVTIQKWCYIKDLIL